ncbi:hypothetical protein YC2023_053123 [Brassica napus]
MLGWSFVMIRNGLTFVLLKPRETLKKRKCEDGAAQSSSSHAEAHEGSNRPPGVKAAKATGKKTMVEGKERLSEFQTMWSIKQQDLAMKKRLSKMSLLDSLIAKKRTTI